MSKEIQIRPATRQGVKPLIGLYAESGCGKTYSALLLARGLAGPTGRIVMIDTESGRGSLYADVIPGGYDVLELNDSFSPMAYVEAFKQVANSGAAVCVVDSASHEWEGLDGVMDKAERVAAGRAERFNKEWDGTIQFGDWKQPKDEHKKFVLWLLRSPMPVIVCLRAKRKSHQVKGTPEMAERGIIHKNQIGKSVVVKDEFTTPIQEENFIFELTAHGQILQDHSLRLNKWSHPSLKSCFPEGKPIEIRHGELLAQWCANPGSAPATTSAPNLKALKKRLWDLTQGIHGGDMATLQQWIVDEVTPSLPTLEHMTADDLTQLIPKVERKLEA